MYGYVNKDKGFKDASISGVIRLLNLIRSNKNIKHIYIVLEGDSSLYENIYEDYKKGRADKSEIFKNFNDYLKLLQDFDNITILRNKYYEADYTLAYLSLNMSKKNKVILYSGDKDFLQLSYLSKNLALSNTFKQGNFIELTDEEIINKFKIDKNKILKYRVFKGDSSDKINSACPRLRDILIRQIVKAWKEDTLDDIVFHNICVRLENYPQLVEKLVENKGNIFRNFNLMCLTKYQNDAKMIEYTKKVKLNVSKEELSRLEKLYGVKLT